MTPDDLLALLSSHIGKGHGLTAQDIAAATGASQRLIRASVTSLRAQGVAVCGTPRDGYFIAATAGELEETCQFLRGRALHSLSLEASLRRIPLPDLLGQLHLKT